MNAENWWHFYKQAPSWIDKPWMKMFHHFSTSSESDHDENDWCRHWPSNLNWTMAVTSIELHLEGTNPVYFSGHRVKGALVVHIGVPIIIAGKPLSLGLLPSPHPGGIPSHSWVWSRVHGEILYKSYLKSTKDVCLYRELIDFYRDKYG